MIENPVGCLACRPYMQEAQWPDEITYCLKRVDWCAFGDMKKKPTNLWTSLRSFRPNGTTGNGLCCQSCDSIIQSGNGKHIEAIAQEPARRPTKENKMAIPQMFTYELVAHLLQQRRNAKQTVVIDLFSGFQSIRPCVEAFGLKYISLDIKA